jgi:PIN domain nuclease of toxin-antitoxin system
MVVRHYTDRGVVPELGATATSRGALRLRAVPQAEHLRARSSQWGANEFAFERLAVTDVHAWAVRALPPLHADPFDRLLAAQALTERASIVSADAVFDRYGVTRIW